ncbi:MAG: flavin reductase, partial [Lachnospiraceae bacterium]|nr:flavin reductase [Lachnospiraceae bacterium]
LVIRPQRYTKEFIDSSDRLSISVLPDGYKKVYGYLGTVSGRNEDKIAKSQLSVVHEQETPYFEEARIVMICRKLFAQPYDPECFIDRKVDADSYPQKNYHTLYICEIEKVLVKE